MNLFKNSIENNLNKTLRKRIYIIVCFAVMIISAVVLFMFFYNDNSILAIGKNAKKRRKVTATFKTTGVNYIEKKKISCYIEAGKDSCQITLPIYNVKGSYTFFWSNKPLPKTNLTGYKWSSAYFYPVGRTYYLTKDTIFYPNTNAYNYLRPTGSKTNTFTTRSKYRKFNIIKTTTIGKTIFEFEKGIDKKYINKYISEVKKIYKVLPWLFIPGKVFALTEKTYAEYSLAYGLTQQMGNAYISIIDLKYDTKGIATEGVLPNSISLNATIHELAHAWDYYYKCRTCNRYSCIGLNEMGDIKDLYNSAKKSKILKKSKNGQYLSRVEFFAAMVTNYYWHILGKDTTKPYYGLVNNKKLNASQKKDLKQLIEKYSYVTLGWLEKD